MNYLEPIVDLVKALLAAVGLLFVRKSGKDSIKKDIAENEIEAIDEVIKARDSINSDPRKRERLRDIFNSEKR